MRISLAAAWRHRGIGSAMLTELERRLVAVGVHRIDCLLATGNEVGALALEHGGYRARPGMVFYEKLSWSGRRTPESWAGWGAGCCGPIPGTSSREWSRRRS